MITFNDSLHKYTNDNNEIYTSVSNLVQQYSKPFNKDYWSKYKAYETILGPSTIKDSRRDLGVPIEDSSLFNYLEMFVSADDLQKEIDIILDKWNKTNKEAIDKGNAYHSYRENLAKEQGYSVNPFTNQKFKTIESVAIELINGVEFRKPTYNNLQDLEDGFHPELILWNDAAKIAGQSDMVYIETIDDKRVAYINDYKTNKKIDTYNPFKHKMLAPLNHLDECNFNHYRLQLSTYAWMLEEAGFKIQGLQISHLNTPYVFKYLREEVVKLMNIKYNTQLSSF